MTAKTRKPFANTDAKVRSARYSQTGVVFSMALMCSVCGLSAQPVSLSIQPNKTQVLISWPAGLSLVQPQKATNLVVGAWQDFGAATTATNTADTTANAQAFYRLRFLGPAIVTQPQGQSAAIGGKATFSVIATGTAPLVYQWRKSGTNLSGQIAASLELTNVASGDAADYSVVITNRVGAATSVVAGLSVASSAVAPRGVFMGNFAGQTNGGFAGLVTSNRLAAVLAYNPGQIQGVLVTNLAVAADGSFSNHLAQTASITGVFASETVNGTLIGTNATSSAFNGTRQPDAGIQQTNAGYYAGTFTGLLTGDVYFILAADGTTFTYLSSPILSGGTFGKIDAANTLSATVSYTLPGTTAPSLILIGGTLNSATHQFTGTYSFVGITLGTFSLSRVYVP